MPCTNRWTDCDPGSICPKKLGRCAVALDRQYECSADDQCLSQYCAFLGPGYQHGVEHYCVGPDALIPEQGQKCGGLLSGGCKAGLICRVYTLPHALFDEHLCEPAAKLGESCNADSDGDQTAGKLACTANTCAAAP
jgi:hypothetical protein